MKTRMIGLYGFLAVMLAFAALGSALASCGGTTQPNLPYGGAGTSNNNGGTGTNNTGTGGGTGTNNNYGTGTNNPVSYTVQFKVNGGSGSTPSTQTANAGSSITLPNGDALSRPGFAFDGWNTEPDGTGTNHSADSSYTVQNDITLYAHWIIVPLGSFTVTFDSNGGSSVTTQTVNSGGTATRPENPAKSGYTFGNWYSNAGLTTVYNFSAPVTRNITLYAKWLPNTAGITLNVEQIIDGAPIIAAVTISRTNNGYPVTSTVSVSASDYDAGSISWKVAGVGAYANQTVSGNGASFTLNAAEVKYNSLGGHVLILTVAKGGIQYQRAIPFTIVH